MPLPGRMLKLLVQGVISTVIWPTLLRLVLPVTTTKSLVANRRRTHLLLMIVCNATRPRIGSQQRLTIPSLQALVPIATTAAWPPVKVSVTWQQLIPATPATRAPTGPVCALITALRWAPARLATTGLLNLENLPVIFLLQTVVVTAIFPQTGHRFALTTPLLVVPVPPVTTVSQQPANQRVISRHRIPAVIVIFPQTGLQFALITRQSPELVQLATME